MVRLRKPTTISPCQIRQSRCKEDRQRTVSERLYSGQASDRWTLGTDHRQGLELVRNKVPHTAIKPFPTQV